MAWKHESERFDSFGLELPFADPEQMRQATFRAPLELAEFEATPVGKDPPRLAQMLAIEKRFDDPARDPAIDRDGTRFDQFLGGRDRREFARQLLETSQSLARTRAEAGFDLKAGDLAKAWFVIHDWGSTGNVPNERFTIATARAKEKKQGRPISVHGFVNREGYYAAVYDFEKTKSGTVYEFHSIKGQTIAGGKTINLETVPYIEDVSLGRDGKFAPPSKPELYPSIGYRKLPKLGKVRYYKWSHAALETLADLYLLASARAGHLLTITVHKEMDRNLARSVIWREMRNSPARMRSARGKHWDRARNNPSDYHGDPYGFDMQALYDVITRKLNALGGLQVAAGARYGIHPLRVRAADGQDVTNGSHHRHQFPHQSSPRIELDKGVQKQGWWNTTVTGEAESEAGDWGYEEPSETGFEGMHSFEEEAGLPEFTREELDEAARADFEELAWIESEAEEIATETEESTGREGASSYAGEGENWAGEEQWSGESDTENELRASGLDDVLDEAEPLAEGEELIPADYQIVAPRNTPPQKAVAARKLLGTTSLVGYWEGKLAMDGPSAIQVGKQLSRFEDGKLATWIADYNAFAYEFEEVLHAIGRLRDLLGVGSPHEPPAMSAVQKSSFQPTDDTQPNLQKKMAYIAWRDAQLDHIELIAEVSGAGRAVALARRDFWQAQNRLALNIRKARRLTQPQYEAIDLKLSDLLSVATAGEWTMGAIKLSQGTMIAVTGVVLLADWILEARAKRAEYEEKVRKFREDVSDVKTAIRDDLEDLRIAGERYWDVFIVHQRRLFERNKMRIEARKNAALFSQSLAKPSETRKEVLEALRMPAQVSDAWRVLAFVGPRALQKLKSLRARWSILVRAVEHFKTGRQDPYGAEDITRLAWAAGDADTWKGLLTQEEVDDWVAAAKMWDEAFDKFFV